MMTTNAGLKQSDIKRDALYCEQLTQCYQKVKDEIDVLSLDCFDTLIWRRVSKPADVFYQLQAHPDMMKHDFSASQRMQGEQVARVRRYLLDGSNEVTLQAIYEAAFPDVDDQARQCMMNAELCQEQATCYYFEPIAALLQQAKQDGKQCIIVSDTYLSAEQLRSILSHQLPSDIYQCIDQVFVSCGAGISKSQGLLRKVASTIGVEAKKILHFGDNYTADYLQPGKDGLVSGLYKQQSEYIDEISRMTEVVTPLLFPAIRDTKPYYAKYQTVFSKFLREEDEPSRKIGYGVLGPIYYNFAQYLKHEYNVLKQSTPNLKVAFLLRDAHLSYLSCKELMGDALGSEVRISRFTSYAASFRSKEDVVHYLASVISGERYKDMMKQLLISPDNQAKILAQVEKSNNAKDAFRQIILSDEIVNAIIKNSINYFQKFKKYLIDTLDIQRGDTLLMVDLGYSCTTQMTLGKILKNEMGVDVVGRYLISLKTLRDYRDRRGLIDQGWCQDHAMLAVVNYIALLEQLSTTTDKSVVSFDESGQPIYSEHRFSDQQYSKVDAIQNECLSFVRDMRNEKIDFKFEESYIREFTLAWLARFVFMPTRSEIDYLAELKFDLNLGTTDTFSIFNPALGIELLQERGLFSIEKGSSLMRTNYPAELRYAGIDLAIMLITQHRYHYSFTLNDATLRSEKLPIIVTDGHNSMLREIEARSTYDGFFSAEIPIGAGGNHLGLLLGNVYKWVQVGSISIIDIKKIYGDTESDGKTDVVDMKCDKVTDHKNGLLECLSEEALCLFSLPKIAGNKHYVLRFNFRPITYR